MEELIRWRLWERTGGGLMAELGSHQLDASTIFCTAARNNGVKAHPLSVTAVGGRHLYKFERQAEDHVYCMFEFPGPKYDKDKLETTNNKIVVTYSSINGNGFGGYGEVVMGDKGTLVLLTEAETMLYGNEGTSAKININKDAVDTTASGGAKVAIKATTDGPVSRGYTEELEHWAWCIRQHDPNNFPPKEESKKPRCYPEAAMADAIIALTTNIAMRNPKMPRIEFKEEWFKIDEDDTPEAIFLPDSKGKKPDTTQGKYQISWDKV
jgi:predicted dehydrogenase